jgi:Arm DNA-binding domain
VDKKTIKNTPPATDGKDVWLWDTGGVVGFYLRVKPSGKRTFGYQYRKPGGQTKRVKIGDFPAFTVEEARVTAAILGDGSAANGGALRAGR